MHYYLINNHHGNNKDPDAYKMFMNAAMTRAMDFLNSSKAGSDDILVMRGIGNMDDIKGFVESDVAEYSGTYGQTAEFGLWSHGGLEGPFRTNSNGSFDQLTTKDWGNINFNWSDNANASFYGCRSGKDPDLNSDREENGMNEYSFAQNLSSMANMKNVTVWGQTERSWPFSYTDVRLKDTNATYMVGSKKAFSGIQNFIAAAISLIGQPTYAYPMAKYQNGQFIGLSHQPGEVKK